MRSSKTGSTPPPKPKPVTPREPPRPTQQQSAPPARSTFERAASAPLNLTGFDVPRPTAAMQARAALIPASHALRGQPLAAARLAQAPLTMGAQPLLAEDGAMDAPPADAAEAQARAEDARTAVGRNPDTVAQDADAALRAMREANALALAENKPPPYPQAENVQDAAAAIRLDAQLQTELFGAPLALSQQQQVTADVATLGAAQDPAAAAVELERMLATASPEYREALLSHPDVQRMLESFARYEPPYEQREAYRAGLQSLVRLGDAMGSQSRLLTDPIARGYPSNPVNLTFLDTLRSVTGTSQPMADSSGLGFAIALDASLTAAQGEVVASDVRNIAMQGLVAAEGEFEQVAEEVAELQQQLALWLQDMGPAMTDEQRQAALDTFMQQHAEVFARFEQLGGLLTGAATSIDANFMRAGNEAYDNHAERILYSSQALGMTRAGSQFFQDMVASANPDQPGLIDHALTLAENSPDFAQGAATVWVQALGNHAAELMARGDTASARVLLQGPIGKYAALFGLDESKFQQVLGELDTLLTSAPTTGPAAQAAFQDGLRKIQDLIGDSRLLSAFGGVALGLATFSFAQSMEVPEDLGDALKLASDAVGIGPEIAAVAAKMVGNTSVASWIDNVGGKVLARFGVGIDVVRSIHAFANGNAEMGAALGLQAVGGAVIAFGGPVGWVVGGAMVIGSALWQGAIEGESDRREAREAFLISAGVPPETAKRLAGAPDGRLQQLAAMGLDYEQIVALAEANSPLLSDDTTPERLTELKDLGFTASQLVELSRTSPDLFTQESGNGFSMERLRDFMSQTGMDAAALTDFLGALAATVPESGAGATSFFFQVLNAPESPRTEAEWIARFQEVAAHWRERDPDVAALFDAAVAHLQAH
ncbi:hypothetical protein HV824_05955 [Myxococcus sp. AM009]|uniref:hypothetical protein n=1 Tax=unclassified Myxococcus TaxID=2648731 RepID=UPI0015956820|nr:MULTISPECIES: hypothetical protein [unclassified Myxococcus]NVI97660.1 hypothetical protein [Myxococcus sp. AM009]NVJ16143.1 hypothetical protein [Myxococcus sp. AM010]